jgi:aryl-alcohol dehydrogenase-like predicted oxidoreductase
MVLGTAQLGMRYGIANQHGQPGEHEALEIVDAAWKAGVTFFDTAQIYGESEFVLGRVFQTLGIYNDARVITKLSPDLNPENADGIYRSIKNSCQALGIENLWGLFIHRPEWLKFWDRGLGDALETAREHGLIKYIGLSAYTVKEAREALKHPRIDAIQVPCNAWDHRMKTEEIFDSARQLGKLCFVRSIYLQGLLAMTPEEIKLRLPSSHQAARHWQKIAGRFGEPPTQLAMRFVLSLGLPVVVGAENARQVENNIELMQKLPMSEREMEEIYAEINPLVNENILNPSQWQLPQ